MISKMMGVRIQWSMNPIVKYDRFCVIVITMQALGKDMHRST